MVIAGALLLAGQSDRGGSAKIALRSIHTQRVLLTICLVCTLPGYFAVQQLLPAARASAGLFSFPQLHLFSTVLYALKTLAVLALAWRASAPLPAL